MRKKLFLSSLAIVLITVFLSVLSVERVIERQFSDYVSRATENAVKELPNQLQSIYERQGHWDEFALKQLGRSLPSGITVILKDLQGNTIATVMSPVAIVDGSTKSGTENESANRRSNSEDGQPGNLNGGMQLRMHFGWQDRAVENFRSKEVEVKAFEQIVALATIYYPARTVLMDPADIAFVNEVFRYLGFAGIIALSLGIGLSWWMSRRLTSPLRRLTEAAHRIGRGHFDERVPVTTNDEIGQLAQAFNTMIDNLAHQEKLRKQFTADIAHELRTPLTSIRSYIEAFQDGVLPVSSENLSAITEEIERLAHLANDLKDLNIAEIGALDLKVAAVDLRSLVDKVIHNLSPLLQEKHLSVHWSKPEGDVTIRGDEALLTRAFYNLIHNAYKYTPPGGKITVTIDRPQNRRGFVQVSIRDTGIGIAADDLENIFERFYRADKSRTRETGGAGIGLALVHQIVKLHKGEIAVKSEVGQGSTFTVTLPVNFHSSP